MEEIAHPGWWKFGLDLVQSVILLVGVVYAFVVNRTTANRREIELLRSDLAAFSNRLSAMPSKQEFSDIHQRITKLVAQVSRNEGQLSQIRCAVNLLHQKELSE